MTRARRLLLLPVVALAAGMLVTPAAQAAPAKHDNHADRHGPVRFATFNASLNRAAAGQLVTDLSTPGNAQAREVAEVIQRNRPDVLLVNEFDYVPDHAAADLFGRTTSSAARTARGRSTTRTRSWRRPTPAC
jgi:hypothetical protein